MGEVRHGLVLLVALALAAPRAAAQTDEEVYDQVVQAGHLLAFGTEEEKVSAAGALGTLRAAYSVPMLAQALGDPSAPVRRAVVGALGLIAHAGSVQALEEALEDGDVSVAAAAARALGEMHTEEAYAALLASLGSADREEVKKALLDGLRRWNEPFTPLPEPRPLPEGKDPPLLPDSALEVKPGKPKTIDKLNPYGDQPPATSPIPSLETKGIDATNPYGPPSGLPAGPSAAAALKSKGTIDKDNPYEGLPPLEEDTWGAEEPEPEPDGEPPRPGLPPSLPVELMDLTPASFVSFTAATSSVDDGTGRVTAMQVRGGYSGAHFGAGASIPFSAGASTDPGGGFEEWAFGNLGMWIRYVGSRDLERLVLRYGGTLALYVPSGDEVEWSDFGTDPDLFTSLASLYACYYEHGLRYPNLEDAFKVSLRPDFDIAVLLGPLSFQLELGFDFLVLGKAPDPADSSWKRDVKDLVMFHLGLSAAVQPARWVQLSLELTSVVEVSGKSARTLAFDREVLGDPADSEVLLTPGVTLLLPTGQSGTGHLTLALRVPLGEIGSSAGPYELGPVLVLSSGFRWGG
jgi:hypothetical protein